MRLFLKFSLLLSIIMIATSIILPRRYDLEFPRTPGPVLTPRIRTTYTDIMVEQEPEIVLIGDSTLGNGVDADMLAQQTGKSIYSISIPGSASSLWYLILKNNIAISPYKPKYYVVIFRDTILTAPGYRVHGSYLELADEYAERHETKFIQLSFINLMNPLEITAERYLPLYFSRANIRSSIDFHLRYFAPKLINCGKDCTDAAMSNMFQAADLEPHALVDAVASAESYLYTPDQLNFDAQVGRSYLPEMIRIAKENNIQLVFVRIKIESADSKATSSPAFKEYISSLANYLANEKIPLLDFSADPRLTHDLFKDSIHLSEQGRVIFTQLFADELKKIVK